VRDVPESLGTALIAFTAVIIRHRVSPFGEPDDRLLRMIQYSRTLMFNMIALEYWILRLRGV
jgi:hypothetical protein